jgi:hypothetical protein
MKTKKVKNVSFDQQAKVLDGEMKLHNSGVCFECSNKCLVKRCALCSAKYCMQHINISVDYLEMKTSFYCVNCDPD